MFRRRRKPRVVWLPPDLTYRLGVDPQSPATSTTESGILTYDATLDISGGYGTNDIRVFPLVKDGPESPAAAANSLSDIESSGYRLRRVVGKLWFSLAQGTNEALPNEFMADAFVATAGIIVGRVDSNGTPTTLSTPDNAPQAIGAFDSPWIWRRSWLLSNQVQALFQSQSFGEFYSWPPSNIASSSSLKDGDVVDQKTARVLSNDERLFLVTELTCWNGDQLSEPQTQDYNVTFDYRVLASMRTSSGNRRNASR